MRPRDILVARAGSDGGFTIEARPVEVNRHYAALDILGASVPISQAGEGKLFGFLPEGCEKGLVVIRASVKVYSASGKFEKWQYENWFFPVERRGQVIVVEMGDALWLAPAGVLPSVATYDFTEHCLELRVREEIFTPNPKGAEEGKRVIENGNLLCRFLVGDITLDELRASATEVIRKKGLDEKYQELLGRNRDLQIQLEGMSDLPGQLAYVKNILTTSLGSLGQIEQELQAQTDELLSLRDCVARISKWAGKWWSLLWNLKELRDILERNKPKTETEGIEV